MTYLSDFVDGFRYAGTLCRENPWHQASHLPIEQVSKFTFMINLKTAKALGMTVSPALLSLADEIIV
jgi:putative ABC transport system substrate-binding protein